MEVLQRFSFAGQSATQPVEFGLVGFGDFVQAVVAQIVVEFVLGCLLCGAFFAEAVKSRQLALLLGQELISACLCCRLASCL